MDGLSLRTARSSCFSCNEFFGNTAPFAGMMVKDREGKVILEQNALK
jgi:hypothetical protein